jgi:hypothetical protein
MSNVREFPPRGPRNGGPAPTDKMILDELEKIEGFMAIARKFGFAITATPAGQKLLSESEDPRAATIGQNVCPVARDPWPDNLSRPTRHFWSITITA